MNLLIRRGVALITDIVIVNKNTRKLNKIRYAEEIKNRKRNEEERSDAWR